MSLTTSRVRALNAVLDEGSYSAAARRLGLSQPAISQAVQDLERAYGVTLFQKRGRQLVPTDLCLELSDITAGIQRLEDDASHILSRGEKIEAGLLRIGLGSLMPGMSIIGAFQKRFPKIQVEVDYAMHAEIIDAVLEQRVDIGVLPNVPKDGRFTSQTYLTQDVVALVPLGHRLASIPSVGISELVNENLIFQKKGSATQRVVDAAFRKADINIRPVLFLETGSEVFEAVANGLGVGFMWRHGTTRQDGARRVSINEINATHEEVIFRRSDTKNTLVELFFVTA